MKKHHPEHYGVLTYPHLETLVPLFRGASRTWSDGTFPLRHALIALAMDWEERAGPGVPCPLSFTEEELEEHSRQCERVMTYESRIRTIHDVLKLEPDGLVEPERYEAVQGTLERLRSVWNPDKDRGPWPF